MDDRDTAAVKLAGSVRQDATHPQLLPFREGRKKWGAQFESLAKMPQLVAGRLFCSPPSKGGAGGGWRPGVPERQSLAPP